MKKFLYVHPAESIAYVIDKISSVPESDVFLVVDACPEIFGDDINLKLLKREADGFSKKITVVSKMPHILGAAARTGFGVSSDDINIENGGAPAASPAARVEATHESAVPEPELESHDGELPWMRKRTAEEILESESEEAKEEKEAEAVIRKEVKTKSPKRFLSWKFIAVSLAVAAILGGAGFYLLSPKVTLSVTLKKTTLNLDFKAAADTALASVDLKNAKIPGQLIKLDKELTGEFTASGKQDKESKAEGEITIYNEFGASSQRLVKNTRFKAKNGNIFRLKSDVAVPGATVDGGKITAPGTITAAVIADQSGPLYNNEPTDFTIPGFEGTPKFVAFYGKSANPMTGGALSGIFFATKEDLDKAKADLIGKFNKSAEELAGTEVPQGMKVLPRARLEPAFDFTAGAADQSGKFSAKLKAVYGVFAFSENDINTLIDNFFAGRLSEYQKLDPGSRTISYGDEALLANNLSLSFSVKASQIAKGNLDESKIKNDLAGKNEDEMKAVLRANEAIESAEFSFWPVWISVAPRDPERIKILTQE